MENCPGSVCFIKAGAKLNHKNKAGKSILQLAKEHELEGRFIERLKAALKEFCGTFNDDITAIAFDL